MVSSTLSIASVLALAASLIGWRHYDLNSTHIPEHKEELPTEADPWTICLLSALVFIIIALYLKKRRAGWEAARRPKPRSVRVQSSSRKVAQSDSSYVALILHSLGIYGVKPDGTYVQINSENWVNSKVALKTGDNEAICFDQKCMYALLCHFDLWYKPVNVSCGWAMAKAAIRSPAHPESVVVIHDWGVYSVNVEDGRYVQLRNDHWSLTKAVVYDPDTDAAVIFHDHGVYRIHLGDGAYTKLSTEGWSKTKAATYVSDGSALVFHDFGIYRVKLADGTYTKLNSESWAPTKAAVSSSEGMVLCIHDRGMYSVNAADGTYIKVNNETWANTAAVCPMGPNAFASSSVVALPPPGQ